LKISKIFSILKFRKFLKIENLQFSVKLHEALLKVLQTMF